MIMAALMPFVLSLSIHVQRGLLFGRSVKVLTLGHEVLPVAVVHLRNVLVVGCATAKAITVRLGKPRFQVCSYHDKRELYIYFLVCENILFAMSETSGV
jgi:hypothetical protein